MSVLVVSVSHKTAPLGLLADLAMDGPATAKLAGALVAEEHIDEAVVLSTCNRTEVHASVSRFHAGLADITAPLAEFAGLSVTELQDRCAVYFDEGAVAHTFGVAAGLDSLVVGENQILGQVKQALSICQDEGSVGTVLNALFQQALRVGKRVQSETAIGSAGRSLVSAAYETLTAGHGVLEGRRLLVVGAGSIASLAARTAHAQGAKITLVNRTLSKAEHLARSIEARVLPFDQLPQALAENEIVVTCTGARGFSLGAADLIGTPVVAVVDLALPADIGTDVAATAVDVINLERLLAEQHDLGGAEIEAARELVQAEVADFLGMRRAAQVAPTVVALRSMASQVVSAEMDRLEGRLPMLGDKERSEVQQTVRRIVDKLLHTPTVRVQELSADPDSLDYAAALRDLFALDPQVVAAVTSAEVPNPGH